MNFGSGLLGDKDVLLAIAAQLMQTKKGQEIPGLGQGLLAGLQAKYAGDERKQQGLLRQQNMERGSLELDALRRQQKQQEKLDSLPGQFFGPQPAPHGPMPDGNSMPMLPPKNDVQGYANALMGTGPAGVSQGIAMQAQLAQMKAKNYQKLGKDENLYDMNDPSRPVAEGPRGHTGPQVGAIREVKSGGQIHTYEWRGSKWEKIAQAPQFKPDAPDKPDKPPLGYRYTQGENGLEPIPGGPADAKVGRQAEQDAKRADGAVQRADLILKNVKDAINKTGFTTAGPIGAIARKIPGTGGFDLDKAMDPIRANIGFAELQQMREASPTGGALGQVAVQELNMLQSVLGSLDTAQTPDQLHKNLYAIERHITNWKNAVNQARSGGPAVRRYNPETGKIE